MVESGTSIRNALETATARLGPMHDSARIDSEILLARVLARPRTYLLAWPEKTLDAQQHERFCRLVDRRAQGTPVAHLTGSREFWSLELEVTPATLIPRPETELLVELALKRIPMGTPCRIADLGTGSGAVALALSHERPDTEVTATDVSEAALQVARRNAGKTGASRIRFIHSDWFSELAAQSFAVIVSNPPYIEQDDSHLSQGDVRHEPVSALASGRDGLDAIRTIARDACDHLEPGGWLLLEHGHDQQGRVIGLLDSLGYTDIAGHSDLAGTDRCVCARFTRRPPA